MGRLAKGSFELCQFLLNLQSTANDHNAICIKCNILPVLFLSVLHLWPCALHLQYEVMCCQDLSIANLQLTLHQDVSLSFGLFLLSSTQPHRAKKMPLDLFHESIWPLKSTSTTSRKWWAWQMTHEKNDSCGFNFQYLHSKRPLGAARATINLSKSYLVHVQYFLRATEMGLIYVYCWFTLQLHCLRASKDFKICFKITRNYICNWKSPLSDIFFFFCMRQDIEAEKVMLCYILNLDQFGTTCIDKSSTIRSSQSNQNIQR